MRRFNSSLFAAIPMAALLVALFVTPASADPRDFVFANNSSLVLTHVFVSASDVNEWGDDILGREVLYSGEMATVSFAYFDGTTCLYDVKVIGQEGQEAYLYKVDLCVVTDVTYSDAM